MSVTHSIFDMAAGEFLCHEHTRTFATVHTENQPPPPRCSSFRVLDFCSCRLLCSVTTQKSKGLKCSVVEA